MRETEQLGINKYNSSKVVLSAACLVGIAIYTEWDIGSMAVSIYTMYLYKFIIVQSCYHVIPVFRNKGRYSSLFQS